ncbi:L-rhamnose mutarotase [Chitinophaga niastensis]|nr:L-rhamnose mutarotase [Chitinophaga niastensis]
MKKNIITIFLIGFLLVACKEHIKPAHIKRFGSVTGLKAEKLNYYKQLHAKAWPSVLKKIKECNIRNYSIYLQKIGNDYYLFSYFEYTGTDFDGDMKKMAADPNTQQWWKETDPCQQPLPETAAKKQIWTAMEEVFHAD